MSDDDIYVRAARIGAYLDGEMTSAELAAFEAELAADALLAADVLRFRGSDSELRGALGSAGAETIEADLLARLGLADGEVVNLADARRARDMRAPAAPPARRWVWPAAGALAAGLAAFLVFGRPPQAVAPLDGLEATPAFQLAMHELPSASQKLLDGGTTVSPRLTFVAGDGRYCREFSVTAPQATQVGIACRRGTTWRIEALAKGDAAAPVDGQLQTAGSDDNAALDATYKQLAGSDPIDGESEKRLIANSWAATEK